MAAVYETLAHRGRQGSLVVQESGQQSLKSVDLGECGGQPELDVVNGTDDHAPAAENHAFAVLRPDVDGAVIRVDLGRPVAYNSEPPETGASGLQWGCKREIEGSRAVNKR